MKIKPLTGKELHQIDCPDCAFCLEETRMKPREFWIVVTKEGLAHCSDQFGVAVVVADSVKGELIHVKEVLDTGP